MRHEIHSIHGCPSISTYSKDNKDWIDSHVEYLLSNAPLIIIALTATVEPSLPATCELCSLVQFHHSLFYWKSQTLCGKSLSFPSGAIFRNHNFWSLFSSLCTKWQDLSSSQSRVLRLWGCDALRKTRSIFCIVLCGL
jgi:hypothetical protein